MGVESIGLWGFFISLWPETDRNVHHWYYHRGTDSDCYVQLPCSRHAFQIAVFVCLFAKPGCQETFYHHQCACVLVCDCMLWRISSYWKTFQAFEKSVIFVVVVVCYSTKFCNSLN